MAASSRGAFAVLGLLRSAPTASPRLCRQCARVQIRAPSRAYSGATAAATTTPPPPPPTSSIPPEPKATTQSGPGYRIKSGVVVTRAPLLTRPLTDFEESYFFYQKRLNERLTLPFITSVYFKPDTPALIDWNMKVKDRQGTVAKELGVYNGKASRAWDDELTVGDSLSKHDTTRELILKDAIMRVSDDAEIIPEEDRVPPEAPQPRVSDADKKNDKKRLDRAMDRTLYLVVKKDGKWEFPAAGLSTEENLHEAAQRVLEQSAGVNMNTWMVGRAPVAHHVVKPAVKQDGSLERKGEKTFFLKWRIMAGQADLANNKHGYSEFQWLTKEELKEALPFEYYRSVRNMLADR
ncbi:mitochondrial 54S ribosomal protein mL46 [Colletotrichum truncatum]|uniref:Mitochondrial ribosomal protein n=1 Tax=Colletotrichum truncatum TaxID=5467 RepID=A0ACC3YJC3_COLTU|nr:putative mitochondrial ribosomal protein [Colletotrichum truncatum]KAF6797245.1 putative mitochondrial ribosomal protein [Colletotrichum truncatum]